MSFVILLMFTFPAYPSSKSDLFTYTNLSLRDDGFGVEGWYFKLNGYYRNLFTCQETDRFLKERMSQPEEKVMLSDLNRFRLSPDLSYGGSFILHADADLEALQTNYNETNEFDKRWKNSKYNDFMKPSFKIADNRDVYSTAGFQNIYAMITAGSFTGTAGRQQVRFGSSRLWNPLDLMNPLSPMSLEGLEEQKGTDAVRLDWFPGESIEITGVIGLRRENDGYKEIESNSGNYIGRIKTGVKEFDAAFLAGYTSRRQNFGTDFTAVIEDGLLTGVFMYSKPDDGEAYYQCGSGYEYTFTSGIYFLIEYFYNSLPVNDDEVLQSALYYYETNGIDGYNCCTLSNRIITYNRHYVSIAAGYDIFPLLRLDLFSIYDFQGEGIFLNAALKLNAMENLDLTAGAVTSFVNENSRTSDFIYYDKAPMFYVSLQYYF